MLSFTPARAEQGAQHCSGAGPHPTEGLQSQLELSHKKPLPWDGEKLVLGGGRGQVQQHHLPPMHTHRTQSHCGAESFNLCLDVSDSNLPHLSLYLLN